MGGASAVEADDVPVAMAEVEEEEDEDMAVEVAIAAEEVGIAGGRTR